MCVEGNTEKITIGRKERRINMDSLVCLQLCLTIMMRKDMKHLTVRKLIVCYISFFSNLRYSKDIKRHNPSNTTIP